MGLSHDLQGQWNRTKSVLNNELILHIAWSCYSWGLGGLPANESSSLDDLTMFCNCSIRVIVLIEWLTALLQYLDLACKH